jgi:hypothetical protein
MEILPDQVRGIDRPLTCDGRALPGSVASTDGGLGQGGPMRRCSARVPAPRSGFAGFRFPPDVITAAVRWYLRYGLSYRDVKELLAERGIVVDPVNPRSYTTM